MAVHRRCSRAQVVDELLHGGTAGSLVGHPQDRRGVDGGRDRGSVSEAQHLTAMPGHAEVLAEQRLRRGRAEADDQTRAHRLDLGVQPGAARGDLQPLGLGVDPALAARCPLEMLDRVGDVHASAVDAGSLEAIVEDSARRPDEWAALTVLAVAGLLADQHDRRVGGTVAEHRLRPVQDQVAGRAAGGRVTQSVEVARGRHRGRRELLSYRRPPCSLGQPAAPPHLRGRPRAGRVLPRGTREGTRPGQAGCGRWPGRPRPPPRGRRR
jgi:hypothetical protein